MSERAEPSLIVHHYKCNYMNKLCDSLFPSVFHGSTREEKDQLKQEGRQRSGAGGWIQGGRGGTAPKTDTPHTSGTA